MSEAVAFEMYDLSEILFIVDFWLLFLQSDGNCEISTANKNEYFLVPL